MKRYRILQFDFDSRANLLSLELGEGCDDTQRLANEERKESIRAGLLQEYGTLGAEQKLRNFVERSIQRPASGAAPIDRAVARDGREPADRRRTPGLERPGAPPNRQIDVAQHFLRSLPVVADTQDHTKKLRRGQLIKGPERRTVFLPGRDQRFYQPRAGCRVGGGANNGAVHAALPKLGEGQRQRRRCAPGAGKSKNMSWPDFRHAI